MRPIKYFSSLLYNFLKSRQFKQIKFSKKIGISKNSLFTTENLLPFWNFSHYTHIVPSKDKIHTNCKCWSHVFSHKQTNNIYMWHGTLQSNSNQREELLKIIEMNFLFPSLLQHLCQPENSMKSKHPKKNLKKLKKLENFPLLFDTQCLSPLNLP